MRTNVEKVLERDQKLSELDDRAGTPLRESIMLTGTLVIHSHTCIYLCMLSSYFSFPNYTWCHVTYILYFFLTHVTVQGTLHAT